MFGIHATYCPKSNPTLRHNTIAEALARVLVSAGLDVKHEAAVSGKQRSADLFIRGLSWPEPDALDITVVNPLADFDSPGASERVAQAESAKHTKYDDLCRSALVKMNAFGVSTLGGVGPEAHRFSGAIREKLCQAHGKRGHILAQETAQRISVACQRAVVAQLMQSVAGQLPHNPVRAGGSVAPSEFP